MPIIDNKVSPLERNLDLCPYYSGFQDCDSGHFYGPAIRDHYLIHFILAGKGFFQIGDRTYHLEKGQGFLICPGIITYYKADDDDPWVYTWVGFHGLSTEHYLKRANLTQENPVFTCSNWEAVGQTLKEMVETRHLKYTKDLRFTGLLYQFLSQLVEEQGSNSILNPLGSVKEYYIQKALAFVQMNYSREMTVEEMANYAGINRKYLSSLFKGAFHTSPQQYLIHFRMNQACELMKNPILSLGEISWSVGYKDQFLFSKMFKKIKGVSPRHYRKTYAEAD